MRPQVSKLIAIISGFAFVMPLNGCVNDPEAPPANFAAGERVVLATSVPLKDGDRIVDSGSRWKLYVVQEVKGDQVRLKMEDEPLIGWVPADQVVRFDEAVDHFTSVIRNSPSAMAFFHRGLVRKDRNEFEKAIADLSEAVRLAPNASIYQLARGQTWAAMKEFDRAIADYDDAIHVSPRDPNAYAQRGKAYHQKGDPRRAIADYDESLRLKPGNIDTQTDRGVAWFEMREFDKAIADFESVIETSPNDVRSLLYSGLALRSKREFDQAIERFTKVIELIPNNPEGRIQRGIAFRMKNDYEKSITDLDEAIRMDPKNALAISQRGATRRFMKQYDRAVEDYSEAIRLEPQDGAFRSMRAIAWKLKKEYAKAVDDQSAAVRLAPENPSYANLYAWTLATCPDDRFRNGRLAVELARGACESTGWKEWTYVDTYAAALAESGDFEEAVKQQAKAIETLSNDPVSKAKAVEQLSLFKAGKPVRDTGD